MALSKTAISSIALISTGAIGGAGLMAHKLINKERFRDKLAGTLLTSSDEDNSKWTARTNLLKKDNSPTLTDSLKGIRGQATEDKIKKWCNKKLDYYFSNKTQLFKDIQKYCVYNIKEKLPNAINISEWNTETHDKKLKNITNKNLSKKMLSIKTELTKLTNPNTDALKKWCESLENIAFEGINEETFKDAKTYCST